MNEFFLWLSSGSVVSILFICIVVAIIVFLLLIYSVAFFQGREISFVPLKIGEKKKTGDLDNKQEGNTLSKEQMKIIFAQARERVIEEIGSQPALLYRPPVLHEQFLYIYSVRHELKRKLSIIVLSGGGHWAGCSMADFSRFFSLAKDNNLISMGLAKEIELFYSNTTMLLNTERVLPEEEFMNIRYLATGIISLLESIVQGAIEKDRRARKG